MPLSVTAATLSVSPWISLVLAVPVLICGEYLVRRSAFLSRYHLPPPVIGGLMFSVAVVLLGWLGLSPVFRSEVADAWWTWVMLPEPRWDLRPSLEVYRPFLVGFFATIGLNASWQMLRLAGRHLPRFLAIAAGLAVLQNAVGMSLAVVLHQSPLLGLMCGSVALTGGHGTALGFADVFERSGLASARIVGMAAATFGLVSGGLTGGPLAASLIQSFRLRSPLASRPVLASRQPHSDASTLNADAEAMHDGVLPQITSLCRSGADGLGHLLLLLVCIKVGAWVSLGLELLGLTVPVYIGAIVVGILLRNGLEAMGARWINSTTIGTMSSVCLGVFLTMAMMTMRLTELASSALPMLVLLGTQVLLMVAYARYVTFAGMGRDYDAAVTASGHCGFALGSTATAMANMKALTDRFGNAPRAYLIVPVVGAFFIDLINALVITAYLNLNESLSSGG